MNAALVEDYRLARAAQDERFNSRPGAGAVDASLTGTEEYRAYFGLGEYMGCGVETRVTFKAFLIARAAERRAERAAAERDMLAELPTHFLAQLAGRAAIDAELERRLAAFDAAHEHEAPFDFEAEVVEVLEAEVVVETVAPAAAVVEAVRTIRARNSPRVGLARVATRALACSYTARTTREDEDMSEITYTETEAGTVTLGRTSYHVEIVDYSTDSRTVNLYGPRGAVYFLREFLGDDTGMRQVISYKSGAPLRDSRTQAEVRVVILGDVIEVAS